MCFPLFNAKYVNNAWIKDRTFCSDMQLRFENAALGMELSGLHNWMITPYNMGGIYDTNSLFTQFFANAAQNAQIMTQNMFCNMPNFNFQFPGMPGVNPTTPAKETTKKKPDEELTDEDRKKFEALQDEFNDLYDTLNEIDEETKKSLGITNILESAKKEYDRDSNTKPETMQTCIDNLKEKISKINDKNLKSILDKVAIEGTRDESANAIYEKGTDEATVESITRGVSVINKSNILLELDTVMGNRGEKSPIEALTSRKDADDEKIKNAVKSITNALIDRASCDDIKDAKKVRDAKVALATARNGYMNEVNGETKKALVEAFENLYKAIKLEKARLQDEANLEKIEELPDVIKEKYVDENGNLKDEYRVNEKETIEYLNGLKKDWVTETDIKDLGFNNLKQFANVLPQKPDDKEDPVDDKNDDENKKQGFWARTWESIKNLNWEGAWEECKKPFTNIDTSGIQYHNN